MSEAVSPIDRRSRDAGHLFAAHPPVLHNPNKQVVFEIACPEGTVHAGRVEYTRWAAMPLPGRLCPERAAERLARHAGFYDYERVLAEEGAVEWHVNFADPQLFGFYGGGLFAQDEMQVAEHPVLGALREALVAEGRAALTVEGGRPTPVLVKGAERRCRVETAPDASEGRPRGLYGNLFASASREAVRRATSRIEPPTVSNVIAIAAPSYGSGAYTAAQVRQVLVTAFTGFRAAVLESGGGPVAVHSGFWGCGVFGGHRVLMTLLQALAAEAAGVARFVLHAPGAAGAAAVEEARRLLRELPGEAPPASDDLVRRVVARRFEWGVGDGN